MRAIDRLNRAVLLVLGMAVLVLGVYGLMRGYGAFGDEAARQPILLEPVRALVDRYFGWFWLAGLLVALLVAYLGLLWLGAQLRPVPSVGEIRLERERSKGVAHVKSSAAEAALASDIESYPRVRSARAQFRSDGEAPEIEVRVELEDDADIPATQEQIEQHALARLRGALEVENIVARVRLEMSRRSRSVL